MSEEIKLQHNPTSNSEKENEERGTNLKVELSTDIDIKDRQKELKSDLFKQCKNSEAFWSAFQGFAILFGVLVAAFLPFYIEYMQNNKIEKLLTAELSKDFEIIKNATSTENIILKGGPLDGTEITPLKRNEVFVPYISLDMWHEFHFQLASSRPKSFARYSALYGELESFVNPPIEDEFLKTAVQIKAAQEFVELYGLNMIAESIK